MIEFVVDSAGSVKSSNVYRALVRNKAQLQYNSVGGWLDGTSAPPPKVSASPELQQNCDCRMKLRSVSKNNGSKTVCSQLQTDEVRPLVLNDQVVDVVKQQKNRATELIEDFMVAANGVVSSLARESFISSTDCSNTGAVGPYRSAGRFAGKNSLAQPDSKALNDLLQRRKAADPDHFADLSLAVIKPSGRENMFLNVQARRLPVILAWQFKITPTPQHPIADLRIS